MSMRALRSGPGSHTKACGSSSGIDRRARFAVSTGGYDSRGVKIPDSEEATWPAGSTFQPFPRPRSRHEALFHDRRRVLAALGLAGAGLATSGVAVVGRCRGALLASRLRAMLRCRSRTRRTPGKTSPATTTSTSSAPTSPTRPRTARTLRAEPVDRHDRRRVRGQGHVRARGHAQVDAARGARLPDALRRGVVDGHSVGRLPAGRPDQARQADLEREVRRVHDAARPAADAGAAHARARLALCRGAADGRGDAPADAAWRSASTASRCRTRTARRCGWSCRGSTASRASSRSCRSASSRSSRATPGTVARANEYGFYANVNPEVDHPRWSQATRAAHRRRADRQAAADAAVQRLRRAGRLAVYRHGPAAQLLTAVQLVRPALSGGCYKPVVFVACVAAAGCWMRWAARSAGRRAPRRRSGSRDHPPLRQDGAEPAADHAGRDAACGSSPTGTTCSACGGCWALFAFFYALLHFIAYCLARPGARLARRSATTSSSGRTSPSACWRCCC